MYPRPPTYVSPIFDKYLKFPEAGKAAPGKRKTGDELPNAISGKDWIQYQKKKKEDKEAEEERKRKKREERETKKAEREKSKGGKKSRKTPREEEVDENVCGECQNEFDDGDEDEWVGCNHCTRWFHVQCTELIGLTREEVEATDFKCFVCDEE